MIVNSLITKQNRQSEWELDIYYLGSKNKSFCLAI